MFNVINITNNLGLAMTPGGYEDELEDGALKAYAFEAAIFKNTVVVSTNEDKAFQYGDSKVRFSKVKFDGTNYYDFEVPVKGIFDKYGFVSGANLVTELYVNDSNQNWDKLAAVVYTDKDDKVLYTHIIQITETNDDTPLIRFKTPSKYPIFKYDNEKYVKLEPGTSLDALKNLLKPALEGHTIIIDDNAGKIGTGAKIRLENGEGQTVDAVTIAVKSDITGDGIANPKDLIITAQQILNPDEITFTKAQELALGEAFAASGQKRLIKLAQQILAVE